MTPRRRLPYQAGRSVEASRSPSSLEEDPPKRRTVEEGRLPDCKYMLKMLPSQPGKNGICLKHPGSLTIQLRAYLYEKIVCQHHLPNQNPRLEASLFKSSEAVLFFP